MGYISKKVAAYGQFVLVFLVFHKYDFPFSMIIFQYFCIKDLFMSYIVDFPLIIFWLSVFVKKQGQTVHMLQLFWIYIPLARLYIYIFI